MKTKYLKGQPDVRQLHPNSFIFTRERSTPNHEVYSTIMNAKGEIFRIWVPDTLIGLQEAPRYFNAFCAKEIPTKRRKRKCTC